MEIARCFRLKFAIDIFYKHKSSQTSKASLQCSKRSGAKQNLTQNVYLKSLEVTCSQSVERQWGN